MSPRTLLTTGLAAVAAMIATAAVVVPKMARDNHARLEHEWSVKNYQEFKTNGKSYTYIMSPENMQLVANDPECAQRLTYAHFDMTDLKAPEFALVQKLPNVKTISFYDCDGIPTLLGYAANMQSVSVIHFDCMPPHNEILSTLASIPTLKRLLFNDAADSELDVFRRALPKVRVDIYDETRDKDPAFELETSSQNATGVQLQSPESPR